jgi:hypothetical protein
MDGRLSANLERQPPIRIPDNEETKIRNKKDIKCSVVNPGDSLEVRIAFCISKQYKIKERKCTT